MPIELKAWPTLLPSGPPDKNFALPSKKVSPRLAANLTMGSLFASDQIEGSWKRLTGLLCALVAP